MQKIREIEAADLKSIAEMIEKGQPFLINSADVKSIDVEKIKKSTVLQVETKWKKQFGSGCLTEMTFGEFMDQVKSDRFYLSTQYAGNEIESENTKPDDLINQVLMPPLNDIRDDLTIHLPFAFNLILQQMNVWIGSGANNSSGLHHDFHDNFYFLQKGGKSFKLYSPKQYGLMYLHGDVSRVYQNGLIVYNNERIREDGAYSRDVADWKVLKAEEALENAETEEEIERAELEMDKALEESLENQTGSDSEIENEEDVNQDEVHIADALHFNSNSSADTHLEENLHPAQKRQKVIEDESPKFPPSFSKIPASDLENYETLSEKFPDFLNAKAVEVQVGPGQILFIPAGWFHEVRSSATDDDYHLALNYWYAPLVSGNSVESPYIDDYWNEVHRQPFEGLLKTRKSS